MIHMIGVLFNKIYFHSWVSDCMTIWMLIWDIAMGYNAYKLKKKNKNE